MAPAATSYLYCSADDLTTWLSVDGSTGRADDDGSGDLSATESGYIARAIQWATARINFFCLGKIASADLARSWIANQWCSIIAAYFLSCRRGNPAAASLKDLYEEAMADLKQIQSGEVTLADAPLRTAGWPAWSNVKVDTLRTYKRVRVELPISETKSGRPAAYQQNTDLPATIVAPYENP